MQGLRCVLLLTGILASVVGAGVWFGLTDSRAAGDGEESVNTVVSVPAEEPPEIVQPAPAREESGPGRGTLTGKVLLFKTGEPVKDVVIALDGGPSAFDPRQEVTDAEGNYFFRELPAGSAYEVRVEHGEFAPVVRSELAVANGEITEVPVVFLEQAVELVVKVVDGAAAPVIGAVVQIYVARGPTGNRGARAWLDQVLKVAEVPTPVRSVPCDEEGTARIPGLPAGYYSVAATAEGYARGGTERLVSPNNAGEPVIVRLPKGCDLRGTVTDEEGNPLAGTIVAQPAVAGLSWGSDFLRTSSALDEDGKYAFTGLPAGPVTLILSPATGPPRPAGRVAVPEIKVFDIRLGAGAVLEGIVTSEDGEPVEGAEVRATIYSATGGAQTGMAVVSDEKGEFRIEGLADGNLGTLEVLADKFARYPPPGTLRPQLHLSRGSVARVEVKLKKGVGLTGVVTLGADKRPVSGARITLMPRSQWGGAQETATTGSDGSYSFAALSPGEYAVFVQADGGYQEEFPKNSWQATQPQQPLDDRWKVRIEAGQEGAEKDIQLAEGGVISGNVEDGEGKPVSGAYLWMSGTSRSTPVYSDEEGNFKYSGMPPADRYLITASLKRRWARSDPISLAPGGRVEGIRLVLKTTGSVTGIVDVADGSPPDGGVVRAIPGDVRKQPWLVRSGYGGVPIGPDGSFRLEDVTPGTVTVIAAVPGHPPAMSDAFEMIEGAEVTGLRLRVDDGHSIIGMVKLKTGRPVADAQILVRGRSVPWGGRGYSGNTTVAKSDEDGRFKVSGLKEAEKYWVTAKKEGLTPASKGNVDPAVGEEVVLEMEEGGEIKGRVIDRNNNPVSGMWITIKATSGQNRSLPQVSSSRDGTFVLKGVPEGTFTVTAAPSWGSRLNYSTAKRESVRVGDPEFDLVVEPGYGISGFVLSPEGKPMFGIAVTAQGKDSSGNNQYKYVQTEYDGAFELIGLPEGVYTVSVSSQGGGFASITMPGVRSGTRDLMLTIERATEIEGIAVDIDGFPVKSVYVLATAMGGSGNARSSRTRDDGRFKITNLAPGNYRLQATAPGKFVPLTLSDVPGGSGGLVLRMDRGKSIKGITLDPTGLPVKGVAVTATPVDTSGGSAGSATGVSDAEGKFKIQGLLDGKYKLGTSRATRDGYVIDPPVEAKAGAEDVKLTMKFGLSVSGTVVDAQGQGIHRAWVGVQNGGNWKQTGTDGSFRIDGLSPGVVKLTIYPPSGRPITREVQAGSRSVQIRVE